MGIFICKICGHIAFENAPKNCPVCAAPSFQQNDTIFKESSKNSKEASVKHIPDVTLGEECNFIPENDCVDVMVRVGETLHPMEEKNFIQFIDCYVDKKYQGRALLTPGLNPAACFHLKSKGNTVTLVEKCNIHGYWMEEKTINP
jgi:superoxide reductase